MNKSKVIYLSIVIIITLSGCAKDGATGLTGPQGTAGSNGNANVSAQTFFVTTWLGGPHYWHSDINVPALTADVQNSGAVEVFFSYDSVTTWSVLPWDGGLSGYKMTFSTFLNYVTIEWSREGTVTGTDPNIFFSGTCKFKVVIIPSAQRVTHPEVNWKNYYEIKTTYNLNE